MLSLKDPNKIDTDFTALTANSQDTVATNETINLGGLQQRGSAIYGENNALTNNTDNTDSKFTDSDSSTAGVQEGYITSKI